MIPKFWLYLSKSVVHMLGKILVSIKIIIVFLVVLGVESRKI